MGMIKLTAEQIEAIKVDAENGYGANVGDTLRMIAELTDATLTDRMKAAGMMSVEQMIKGHPFDTFHAHAGVTSLAKFEEWLEMKRAEYIKMHARFDLDKKDSSDEMYEWVLAHSAVFNAVHINFRNAMKGEKDA